MRLPKKKAKIVLEAVATLQADQVITAEIAETIKAHVEPISFDWRRLARYSFIAAMACVIISVTTAVFDEVIVRWFARMLPIIQRFFHAPPAVRSVALLVLSAVIFWLGLKRRAKFPDRVYTNEAIFSMGVFGIAGSIYCLSRMTQYLELGTYLTALAGFLYVILGAALESKTIWVYGLLTLSGALGGGTGYEMGSYYLWQDTPVLSCLYGMALVLLALGFQSAGLLKRWSFLFGTTRVIGLLHVFVALWILSIWGSHESRYGSDDFRWDCVIWAILFGAVAAVTVARSLEKDDSVLRGFGLTFFFINLYTAFFQYFWNGLHKAIFFAILGASFWLIGRKAESLWQLKGLRRHGAGDQPH